MISHVSEPNLSDLIPSQQAARKPRSQTSKRGSIKREAIDHEAAHRDFVRTGWARLFAKPVSHGTLFLFAGFSLFAVVNALFLQKPPHASPFNTVASAPSSTPLPPSRSAAFAEITTNSVLLNDADKTGAKSVAIIKPSLNKDVNAALVPPATVMQETSLTSPVSSLPTPVAPAPTTPAAKLPAPKPVAKAQAITIKTSSNQLDPIAKLLNRPTDNLPQTHAANSGVSGHDAAAPLPSKTILSAERALQRLGYVVPVDGKISPATHAAIAQFEHDRMMPVHGDFSPQVLGVLAKEAGLTID